jgi:hypothetical protein
MAAQSERPAGRAAQPGKWGNRLYVLALGGLLTWQGHLTLSLFGPDRPWVRLLDDQPILSGRHPLHLYHGYLGAQAFFERGSVCCYDPAFQAGYPKTPVFDSGSRPAELFLGLAGGGYRPAAYKVGLAASCLAVPLLLAAAAWGLRLGRAGTCSATALGLLIWWGTPCRQALEAGDLDGLFAALAALAHAGLLVRFDRQPGFAAWLGLLLTGGLGWFSHPVLFAATIPLVLVYYLSVGARHRHLAWHAALWATQVGAVGGNAFWLGDWFAHWWIRLPQQTEIPLLAHRTFHTVYAAPLWGEAADRALALPLLGLAALGVAVLNGTHRRAAARLLGLGGGGFLVLAILGIVWEPLGQLGTCRLLVPALWFAVLPAVHAVEQGGRCLGRRVGAAWCSVVVAGGLALAAGLAGPGVVTVLAARCLASAPLTIGLGPERQALVAAVRQATHTDQPEARILWEEDPAGPEASSWTALLPLLTDRFYLGGLDPEASIEHAYARLTDQTLAGRSISDWSDLELEDFCRRYNVGWIVCWSPRSTARFRAWTDAEPVLRLPAERPGYLFKLHRQPSFALKGQARLIQADCQRLALADVVPEDGSVVLSFHYQAGLQASPSRVQVEREPDPHDPIPFIRLRVPGPIARVTLTWKSR